MGFGKSKDTGGGSEPRHAGKKDPGLVKPTPDGSGPQQTGQGKRGKGGK
ncbi:hypothetical protein ACWGCW_15510 [Streptomyces sp. NPDC054933]